MNINCKICNKLFYIRPSHFKRGRGIYCSRDCFNSVPRKKKHNFLKTRFYRCWQGMKYRCSESKNKYYDNINVCDDWLHFLNFKNDMYYKYIYHCKKHGEKNTTLDRINNDGNYEPSNCRWATKIVQMGNRSNNKFYNWNGKKISIKQLTIITGFKPTTIQMRINRGWSINDAITKPLKYNFK